MVQSIKSRRKEAAFAQKVIEDNAAAQVEAFRTISTAKKVYYRVDTGNKTSLAYAAANPDKVIVTYEHVEIEEKI